MPLIAEPMLDFTQIATPAGHGDVLVLPHPSAWVSLARENQRDLARATTPLLDTTLGAWRSIVRQRVAGVDNAIVFALGHQPEFIHPGVWAKHVAAMRAASACDGVAINLVVDNDAPIRTTLRVPGVEAERVALHGVPFAHLPHGYAYEQIQRHDARAVDAFESGLTAAMGGRYAMSMMPTFFEAFRAATEARDWVDQAVAGRRAVEAALGVSVEDRRVSDVWCSPLLVDIVLNVERFTEAYNGALADYRVAQRVRGAQRPIPDLRVEEGRWEIPVWAYRADEPRRRLFVVAFDGARQLFAGGESIGVVRADHLHSCEKVGAMLTDLTGWRLRPRALTLTIWARLLLADLFIHGIGGAKYDRISDSIIERYYRVKPPHMACVSATLHMDLPVASGGVNRVRAARAALRDLTFNPQRHLRQDDEIAELWRRREDAVRRSRRLSDAGSRDRRSRRAAYQEIRDASAAILALRPEAMARERTALAAAIEEAREAEWALGREYFFALYDRQRLDTLLRALPDSRAFGV